MGRTSSLVACFRTAESATIIRIITAIKVKHFEQFKMASFMAVQQEMSFRLEGRSKVMCWVDFQIQKKTSIHRFAVAVAATASAKDRRMKHQKMN